MILSDKNIRRDGKNAVGFSKEVLEGVVAFGASILNLWLWRKTSD